MKNLWIAYLLMKMIFLDNLSKFYGTLFCLDLEGKKFDGYFDSPYIYYF